MSTALASLNALLQSPEDARIARFQPHDPAPRQGMFDQQRIDVILPR